MRLGRCAVWSAVVLVSVPAPATGQLWRPSGRPVVDGLVTPVYSSWRWSGRAEAPRIELATPTDHGMPQSAPTQVQPGIALLLSLGLPGAGQHVLGQRRKWIYAGLEGLAWAVFAERRHAGGRARDRYRDFAWSEARIQAGARVDPDFPYYETLTHWARSGEFDRDPSTAGVQPELDGTTFNGSIWARAVGIFLPGGTTVPVSDPEYQAALAYYTDRAYSTQYLWDWSANPAGQQELDRLISVSDGRFRDATNVLGAILANHVVSSADAYLAGRRLSPDARLSISPGRPGFRYGWTARLVVPVPR